MKKRVRLPTFNYRVIIKLNVNKLMVTHIHRLVYEQSENLKLKTLLSDNYSKRIKRHTQKQKSTSKDP